MNEDKKPLFIQTELGKEKYCKGCDDYHPATKEFFWATGWIKKDGSPSLETLCKACYKARYKPWVKGCYNISHRYAGASA